MKKLLGILMLTTIFYSCKKDLKSNEISETEVNYKNLFMEKFHFKMVNEKATSERLNDRNILHFTTYKEAYEYYSKAVLKLSLLTTAKIKSQNMLRTNDFETAYYSAIINTADHIDGSISGTLAVSVPVNPIVKYSTRQLADGKIEYFASELYNMNWGIATYGWSGAGHIDQDGIGGASLGYNDFYQNVQHYVTVNGSEFQSVIGAYLVSNISVPSLPTIDEVPSEIIIRTNMQADWVQ